MNIKLKVLSASIATFAFSSIILIAPVSASTKLEERQEALNERIDNARTRVQSAKDARCERVATRVQERVNNYKTNRDNHISKYNEIKENVSKVLSNLESKGHDVSKVKEDLFTLESMVNDFRNNNEDTFVALIESGEMACAENKEQFQKNMDLAKQYLGNVKDGAKEIKEFIQGTLKEDLKILKEEIKSK